MHSIEAQIQVLKVEEVLEHRLVFQQFAELGNIFASYDLLEVLSDLLLSFFFHPPFKELLSSDLSRLYLAVNKSESFKREQEVVLPLHQSQKAFKFQRVRGEVEGLQGDSTRLRLDNHSNFSACQATFGESQLENGCISRLVPSKQSLH